MASRTKQKEEARARRLAEERARAEKAQRNRRNRTLIGVLVAAVVVVGVAIVISSSGGGSSKAVSPNSAAARSDVAAVNSVLNGIPQSGQTLGNPNAPVTITEYADLECPVCDAFALPTTQNTPDGIQGTGYLNQLINQYVRTGKAKIVYRSLETATGNGPNASMWTDQQASAYAAGLQNKAWYYIELFYHEQGQEGTAYVTPAYLSDLAKQVPGLDDSQWQTQSKNPQLQGQVTSDDHAAVSRGFQYTPTIVIQGPKGEAPPIQSLPSSYSQLTSEISSVS